MKLFYVFHWRIVALRYHVHCDTNKRMQNIFITLDSRYEVTFAEGPLWCFPLPTGTNTELSWTLGPHRLSSTMFDIFDIFSKWLTTLQWRHNGCDRVSNHQPYGCLLNCLFKRRSKKTSKLRVTGLCEFPAQRASNAEKGSIWWRHHENLMKYGTKWWDPYCLGNIIISRWYH